MTIVAELTLRFVIPCAVMLVGVFIVHCAARNEANRRRVPTTAALAQHTRQRSPSQSPGRSWSLRYPCFHDWETVTDLYGDPITRFCIRDGCDRVVYLQELSS